MIQNDDLLVGLDCNNSAVLTSLIGKDYLVLYSKCANLYYTKPDMRDQGTV